MHASIYHLRCCVSGSPCEHDFCYRPFSCVLLTLIPIAQIIFAAIPFNRANHLNAKRPAVACWEGSLSDSGRCASVPDERVQFWSTMSPI